jgi:hypothetical protein
MGSTGGSVGRTVLRRIVSGGQTGVDRAALDSARERGIPNGGWCPAGRWAEDGPISQEYALRETPEAEPAQRTAWNVRDSDGTLLLARGEATGGTALTIEEARNQDRPLLIAALDHPPRPAEVRRWIEAHGVAVLNVAGPRESECPGIYREARAFLELLFLPPE